MTRARIQGPCFGCRRPSPAASSASPCVEGKAYEKVGGVRTEGVWLEGSSEYFAWEETYFAWLGHEMFEIERGREG